MAMVGPHCWAVQGDRAVRCDDAEEEGEERAGIEGGGRGRGGGWGRRGRSSEEGVPDGGDGERGVRVRGTGGQRWLLHDMAGVYENRNRGIMGGALCLLMHINDEGGRDATRQCTGRVKNANHLVR